MRITLVIGAIFMFFIILFSAIKRSDIGQNKPNTAVIDGKKYDVIKYVIDTQYYPKIAIKKVKGDDIVRDTIIYVPTPINIDTLDIIKDYFSKKIFVDTLKIDSMGFVAIKDTVSENKIIGRRYVSSLKMMIVNKTLTVREPNKWQLHAGFGASFDKINLMNGLHGDILIKTKKDKIFSIGMGIDHTSTPFVNTTIYWKIR